MNPDFLIIGGGIIGVCIARELKRRNPDASILLLEKENHCGEHASGRNSGVLHAGFYYTADSLKARFTRDGNARLTALCDSRGLSIRKCGKLVVTQNERENEQIDVLLQRAQKNGVELEEISEKEVQEIEPRCKTYGRALYSPNTSTIDPAQIMNTFYQDAEREGIVFRLGESYVSKEKHLVRTTRGTISAGYVVNAAGLYADRIARDFCFSKHYRILPFKGLYAYSSEPPGSLKTHIYPVPDLRNPFLGVHFTVTVDGKTKIGPTAIPAFWREQYTHLENFNFKEFLEILYRQCRLFFNAGFDFKQLAMEEIKKYYRPHLVRKAAKMLRGVQSTQYRNWGRPGIRAQLLDIRDHSLVMDFKVEGDAKSIHILNAVSPAFTCALPFADFVVDQIERLAVEEPN